MKYTSGVLGTSLDLNTMLDRFACRFAFAVLVTLVIKDLRIRFLVGDGGYEGTSESSIALGRHIHEWMK